MRAEDALALAKSYTKKSLLGGGAVVGKNVTIQSIVAIDGGNRVTFSYTLDDGTVSTSAMDVMDGGQGASVSGADINAAGELVLTLTDGTEVNAGTVPSVKGDSGFSPTITAERNADDSGAILTITNESGSDDVEIKDGKTGATPKLTMGEVQTLPYGSEAQAVITGTAEEPVLSLAIPQGKQGDGSDYQLPIATTAQLGGVKIGEGLSITADGTLSADKQEVDLTNYYDKSQTATLLGAKVDKVSGMGLSSHDYTLEEKTKLAGLSNYDDTEIRTAIDGKVDKVEGKGLSSNDFTDEYIEKINAVQESMLLKGRVDSEDDLPSDPSLKDTYFVGLEGSAEFEQYTYTESGWVKTGTTSADLAKYLTKDEATGLFANKVDKVDGKGLSTNDYTTAEKEKLAGLVNYDDSAVLSVLSTKADKTELFSGSYNDLSDTPSIPSVDGLATVQYVDDGLALKANKEDVPSADDFATADALTQGLSGKVDKVLGKGLSTNDYTDEDKAKLATVATISDDEVSENSVWSSSKVKEHIDGWTRVNGVNGKVQFPALSEFTEILVTVYLDHGGEEVIYQNQYLRDQFSGVNSKIFNIGGYWLSTNDFGLCTVSLSPDLEASIRRVYFGGIDYTSSASIIIRYR